MLFPFRKRKPFDVRTVNPRYGRAKMNDVARALMRPKDPRVREELENRRSVARDKLPAGKRGV